MEEKPVRLLTNFIDGSCRLLVKFNAYIFLESSKFQSDRIVLDHVQGQVVVNKLRGSQKFYSNIELIECSENINSVVPNGKRITRIRDLIFIDSQVYLESPGGIVLKLKDDDGFIQMKVQTFEYKAMIKQLKL